VSSDGKMLNQHEKESFILLIKCQQANKQLLEEI
jgi:hypothetical protein